MREAAPPTQWTPGTAVVPPRSTAPGLVSSHTLDLASSTAKSRSEFALTYTASFRWLVPVIVLGVTVCPPTPLPTSPLTVVGLVLVKV